MLGHAAHATNAYRRLAVESAALGADRHQLIALLFAGTQTSIRQARAALARGDIGAKAIAASKAIRLLDEGLKFALDRNVGEIAESLYQLYDYGTRRLLQAQLRNDDAAFAEVAALIGQIESAWTEIGPNGDPTLKRAA